jgi:hypothetical protein
MRDPLSSNDFSRVEFFRNLFQDLSPDSFLLTACAADMVEAQELVAFKFRGKRQVISPRIPFVSYPYEWCDAQFIGAAELTLTLSEKALAEGFELKDASAWNVIFVGCKPVFCDHLSFVRIRGHRWWAFAQFIRQFIFPLCLSKYRRLNANVSFKIGRDGLEPHQARTLMGARRFATRYWPLMLETSSKSGNSAVPLNRLGRSIHKNLYLASRWFLKGLFITDQRHSTWSRYTMDRSHYSQVARQFKYQTVEKWLRVLVPSWLIDFGCNTGEYSKLAAACGAKVVALDLDHESIQNLYLSSRNEPIFPIVANLDDLLGGRGWGGFEFPGLVERLTGLADVLLMLALIHHVAVSCSIPYERIAELASNITKRYVILEMIDSSDPLVMRLATQRDRRREEFSIEHQRQAFGKFFGVVEETVLPESGRFLVLLEKL